MQLIRDNLLSILGIAVAIAYLNALAGGQLFDDHSIVGQNPTIVHLGSLGKVLNPPRDGTPVQGRPFFNLTLALNYAIGGTRTPGYHIVNVLLHILNAILLFALVRRTLALRDPKYADVVAFTAALIWGVHPLDTAAVDYIGQRSELLMACFYLTTLYCVHRAGTGGSRWWQAGAVLACFLGVASKEVMVTAPVIALLYDRVFLARSWRECISKRGIMYLGLAATWIPLAALVIGAAGRGHTAGFGEPGKTSLYWLTQCEALVMYQKLTLWPHPLIFDYGTYLVSGVGDVRPQLALLAVEFVAIIVAWRLRPWLAFLATVWFAILMPTSVVPVWTQTLGEHRAYLPAAAAITAGVVLLYHLGRRLSADLRRPLAWGSMSAAGILAVGFIFATRAHGELYATELSIQNDVIQKRPENARAYYLRGTCRSTLGEVDEAIADLTEAIRLQRDYAAAYNNRGAAYVSKGEYAAAIADYSRVIKLTPSLRVVYVNRAAAYLGINFFQEAFDDVNRAISLDANFSDAYYIRGSACAGTGRVDEAIADWTRVIEMSPNFADAYTRRGDALENTGHHDRALADFDRVIQLRPKLGAAYLDRAACYASLHRYEDARRDIGTARDLGQLPSSALLRKLKGL